MNHYNIPASSDGLELSIMLCEPVEEPRASLMIVHGMCEHKERYASFMEYAASKGYVCVIYDQRGHGQSAKDLNELGFMRKGSWRALVEDCRVIAEWVAAKYPNLPHHLLGHSMGSMVVRSFIKRYDNLIDYLVVSGCPSDNPAKAAGLLLARMTSLICGEKSRPKLLQAMSFGNFNKRFASEGWPAAWVCSDHNVLKDYHSDPLCTYQFTSNGFEALLGLMSDCYSPKAWTCSKPQLPILFVSGEEDPCALSPKALDKAVSLLRRVGYKNVELKTYPAMRHEVLNEIGKEKVWEDVLR